MENLYTVKTRLSFKDYRDFVLHVNFSGKDRIKLIYLLLFFAALTFCMWIIASFEGALFTVVLYFVIPFVLNWKMKRIYKSDPWISSEEYVYNFYADSMEVLCGETRQRFKYDDILKLDELKTCFYVIVGYNAGFVIKKEECTNELQDYIRGIK